MAFDNLHFFICFQDQSDVSEFKFSKFAATYFEGQATSYHISKNLSRPLLSHEIEADKLVSILNFFCFMPLSLCSFITWYQQNPCSMQITL